MGKGEDRQSLSSRLSSRATGLARRQMPGGGEAFGGPTASRALKALGARAMTMDRQIFVDDGFDANKPEDLALYAHEQHHQAESGGLEDGHSEYDAEEVAARARERLVLHRAGAGDSPDAIMGDLAEGEAPPTADAADDAFAAAEQRGNDDAGGEADPVAAYRTMLKDGKQHAAVVRELADYVVQALQRQNEEQGLRSSQEATTE